MEIRAASDADWPTIWPIVEAVVRAGETFTYPRDADEALGRTLWMMAPPGVTLVAVEAGRVLGTAKTGPNQMGPGSHVATASFMVAADARGRGVGRALCEAVIARAKADGYRAMQFNAVVETNRSAVRLWKALGFGVVGTVPEAFAHPTEGLVGLHVMHRGL
ncbi:MAG: GNAT family N-acetyltransferase [Brevundimonas sp.]|uniref:GNAT family N-acetyltransferase n=1 Tax=Brevundimonas sp. TaxID=1871086 RepID=UPI002603ECD8|nr:GNAT family N-acetyltransferase [Brevundimonas sp.]MDI6624986.1 GNAT family N-acetyltransferase [Brevundimonas sp.]MDQ7811321.1 GNAT family N-acetyltransferase [Brevundimonas sp.]